MAVGIPGPPLYNFVCESRRQLARIADGGHWCYWALSGGVALGPGFDWAPHVAAILSIQGYLSVKQSI